MDAEKPDEPAPTQPAGDLSERGLDLLIYGNEQVLQASDNGTLIAFAALAFQQIRGRGEFQHDVGCGFLLLSVLMCAIVHFAMGNAYIGRAKQILRQARPSSRPRNARTAHRAYISLAWIAAVIQFGSILIGCLLILPEKPLPILQRTILRLFV
jgi:ABC-type Fe3+ transport system permease subunit